MCVYVSPCVTGLLIFKGYEEVSDIDCVSKLAFLQASGSALQCVCVCVCVIWTTCPLKSERCKPLSYT